jgi:non-canonical (house-cleaning) NTP pyrophosphatase
VGTARVRRRPKRLYRPVDATVEPVAVDSGVSEQPSGIEETVTGVETRARRAHATTDAEFGVGIEGGVAEFDGTPGLFLVMWAAVTDVTVWSVARVRPCGSRTTWPNASGPGRNWGP